MKTFIKVLFLINNMVAKKSVKKTDSNKVSEKKPTNKKETISKTKKVKMNLNPWMIGTIVLGISVIVLLSLMSANTISKAGAGNLVLDFAEEQGVNAELVNVEIQNGLYKVNVNVQGQEVPLYITKDGEGLIQGLVPFSELMGGETATQQPTTQQQAEASSPELPKSDKPVVDLFIMSHCPYGTQAMKGMVPAARALGDTIDFNLRFVNYAMHGEKEINQQLDMYCIREEQEDKLLDYLECFLGTTSGTEEEGKACLEEVGIDVTKLDACFEKAYEEFGVEAALAAGDRYPSFKTDDALNTQYGVRGSPTLVVNGVQAPYGRDSASYLRGICSTFNNAPSSCNTQVSSVAPGPGFGWETTGANTDASC